MDGEEYRAALEKLGLTQVEAAKVLHVDDRTSRRWAGDEVPIPYAAATLLRCMVLYKPVRAYVLRQRRRDDATTTAAE
jgi:DNA-binding transcriptional regulator YiaG